MQRKSGTLENYINSLRIHLMCMLQQRHLLLSTSNLLSFSYIIVISFFNGFALLENFPIKVGCYVVLLTQKKVNTAKYARREDCNALKLNRVLNTELSQYHHGVVTTCAYPAACGPAPLPVSAAGQGGGTGSDLLTSTHSYKSQPNPPNDEE